MALFWHMVFATGNSKVELPPQMVEQMAMFRGRGLGNYRALLLDLAKDPAMICWQPAKMAQCETREIRGRIGVS